MNNVPLASTEALLSSALNPPTMGALETSHA